MLGMVNTFNNPAVDAQTIQPPLIWRGFEFTWQTIRQLSKLSQKSVHFSDNTNILHNAL